MPIARYPLHRSVRAGLPHTAPALGRGDQTLVRVLVTDVRVRTPIRDQVIHATPAQIWFWQCFPRTLADAHA